MFRFREMLCALSVIFCSVLSGCADNEFLDGNIGPPWGCAQLPILQLGDALLYYADWFPGSCNDDPFSCYMIGDYDWPQVCPDCVPGNDDDFLSKRFPGLGRPITEEYVLQLPKGPAREYSESVELPDLKHIQFKDAKGRLVTAKVFAFRVYMGRILQKPEPDPGRMIVVAMQMEGEPSSSPVNVECRPLDKAASCHAYATAYTSLGDQRLPILVLTAD